MLARRASLRAILWLLCLSLVALRFSGAYLHLCFDGSEPPATVHYQPLADFHNHTSDASTAHEDRDIPLAADLLFKAWKPGFDLPVFLAGFWILWALFAVPKPWMPVSHRLPFLSSPRTLLPPLRGPPSLNLR